MKLGGGFLAPGALREGQAQLGLASVKSDRKGKWTMDPNKSTGLCEQS